MKKQELQEKIRVRGILEICSFTSRAQILSNELFGFSTSRLINKKVLYIYNENPSYGREKLISCYFQIFLGYK